MFIAETIAGEELLRIFANFRELVKRSTAIVAKVFFRGGTQILRPVDAAIE
jgi:hypothetical protein